MFSVLIKAPSWPSKYKLTTWRSPLLTTRFQSTIDKDLAAQNLVDIRNKWEQDILHDRPAALANRYEVYDQIRKNGLHSHHAEWSCTIVSAIPPPSLHLADYLFTADALCQHRHWKLLKSLLTDLAVNSPTNWEQVFLHILNTTQASISQRSTSKAALPDTSSPSLPDVSLPVPTSDTAISPPTPLPVPISPMTGSQTTDSPQIPSQAAAVHSIPVDILLDIISRAATSNGVDLSTINRNQHAPLVQMLQHIMLRYSSEAIIDALDRMHELNPVDASTLASALLRVEIECLYVESTPQSPGENMQKLTRNLHSSVWQWKVSRSIATGTDLALHMIYLVYLRQSTQALKLFDSLPQLHSHQQYEALFLACAGASDYARLQQVFEEVEKNIALRNKVGTKRYEVVIKALGHLGESGVLDDIYQRLQKSHPNQLTRGVFHALIYSNTTRGDLFMVRKMYNTMLKQGIEPSASTFNLVLRAYRDSRDLKGALSFVGDEMIARHQFPLRNSELSLLLSLCAVRRDYKSAQFVWKWGNSLLTPNSISWVTYLESHTNCNQFDDAWRILEEIKSRGMLRIECLTVMMNAANRSGNVTEFSAKIMDIVNKEKLALDSKWYLAMLRVIRETGDLRKFENVLKDMKAAGISLGSSHYALYLEVLIKAKKFTACESVMNEARGQKVPLSFPLIEKYLRSMSESGTTFESRQMAEKAAFDLVRSGYFDPYSSVVPRGAVPVYVIEPVVRRMIKSRQHVSAKQLLDGLQKQRVGMKYVQDEYLLWGLYMEVAFSSQNFGVIDKLWSNFTSAIQVMYMLHTPAAFSGAGNTDTSGAGNTNAAGITAGSTDSALIAVNSHTPASTQAGNASGNAASTVTGKPVFKLPSRYRKDYWKQVDIRIEQLAVQNRTKDLLELPSILDTIGLEMTGKNINSYIIGLVKVNKIVEALNLARNYVPKPNFNLSRKAQDALVSVIKQVNYHDFGMLGYILNKRAKFGSSTR